MTYVGPPKMVDFGPILVDFWSILGSIFDGFLMLFWCFFKMFSESYVTWQSRLHHMKTTLKPYGKHVKKIWKWNLIPYETIWKPSMLCSASGLWFLVWFWVFVTQRPLSFQCLLAQATCVHWAREFYYLVSSAICALWSHGDLISSSACFGHHVRWA